MRNFLTLSSKIVGVAVFALLLTVSSFAQPKLTRAMDTDLNLKADFSVFRPTNNFWYISKSGGGFVFQPFGTAGDDVPAPGDFDGDLKGDISVLRDSTGYWLV